MAKPISSNEFLDGMITENAILRELLLNIIEDYYNPDNGRTLRWAVEAAKDYLKENM